MNRNPNIPPPTNILKPEDLIPDRMPGELQADDIVAAEEMPGFDQAEVYLTIEKKKLGKYLHKKNEDNVLVDPETGLMGVMDGLGGMRNGDLASLVCEQVMPGEFRNALVKAEKLGPERAAGMLLETQSRKLRGLPEEERRHKDAEKMIRTVVGVDPELVMKGLALIEALQAASEAVSDTGGMTTACIGLIHEARNGKRYAVVANVGDSAAYVRRADGRMERLTHEDSAYESLVRRGVLIDGLGIKDYIDLHRDPISDKVSQNLDIPIPLTQENCLALGYGEGEYEARKGRGDTAIHWTYGDLMVTVIDTLGGPTPPSPSLEIVEVRDGDEILFCTDGLVDKYEDPATGTTDLAELGIDMETGNTPEERLDNLRTLAKHRRTYKLDDDIAIVKARIKKRNGNKTTSPS